MQHRLSVVHFFCGLGTWIFPADFLGWDSLLALDVDPVCVDMTAQGAHLPTHCEDITDVLMWLARPPFVVMEQVRRFTTMDHGAPFAHWQRLVELAETAPRDPGGEQLFDCDASPAWSRVWTGRAPTLLSARRRGLWSLSRGRRLTAPTLGPTTRRGPQPSFAGRPSRSSSAARSRRGCPGAASPPPPR